MIQRTILLQLRPEHHDGLTELGQRILALLRSRPMVADARVATTSPALAGEGGEWDLVVTVLFPDAASLTAYREDTVHADFVREQLAPLLAARSSFDLVVLGEPEQS